MADNITRDQFMARYAVYRARATPESQEKLIASLYLLAGKILAGRRTIPERLKPDCQQRMVIRAWRVIVSQRPLHHPWTYLSRAMCFEIMAVMRREKKHLDIRNLEE